MTTVSFLDYNVLCLTFLFEEEIGARNRKQVIRESLNRLKSRLQKQKNTKATSVPGKAGEKRKKKEDKEKRVNTNLLCTNFNPIHPAGPCLWSGGAVMTKNTTELCLIIFK